MYTVARHSVGRSVGLTGPHGVLAGPPWTVTSWIGRVGSPAAASAGPQTASAQILASWKNFACRSSAGSNRVSEHTVVPSVASDVDSGCRASAVSGSVAGADVVRFEVGGGVDGTEVGSGIRGAV